MELSSAVNLITAKIVFVLENEASLLTEVGAEINEIKLELNAIKAFLDDADRSSRVVASNETYNQWVASIRDIAYEVEDVVDEFMYHFNKQQLQQATMEG
ncbi:disease resistance protein RPM1-like [Hibiscus syriacus]|uniref:disease resistance protein RPM1-like n=1 Tax=Hibiscus syriacus TaxID=106335 RepID=UPI001921639D|nr:disease resistance protein RPM1-like [Hibiscus syriacus]